MTDTIGIARRRCDDTKQGHAYLQAPKGDEHRDVVRQGTGQRRNHYDCQAGDVHPRLGQPVSEPTADGQGNWARRADGQRTNHAPPPWYDAAGVVG